MMKVAYTAVLRCFDESHPINPDNTNGHARNMLALANEKFGGMWGFQTLGREDVLNIFLPHHISEGGAIGLIPPSGLTLREATDKLRKITIPAYQSANPVCWQKITYWMENYPSPIFLSLGTVAHSDYENFAGHEGHLIHLDGLHRLLGWAIAGKLDPDKYERGEKVTAYVAGLK
jgi:hypothetical protein